MNEREHWLSITDDPEWRRNHIADPNISQEETLAAIVSAFPADPRRILEIGCGYGRLTEAVADLYPDAELVGVDINPNVLPPSGRAQYVVRDHLTGLSGFDAMFTVAVFQHLPDAEKRAYVEQSYGALNPSGVLRVQFIEGDRDNFCDHWVGLPTILSWFEDAGFHVTEVTRGHAHMQWCWISGVK